MCALPQLQTDAPKPGSQHAKAGHVKSIMQRPSEQGSGADMPAGWRLRFGSPMPAWLPAAAVAGSDASNGDLTCMARKDRATFCPGGKRPGGKQPRRSRRGGPGSPSKAPLSPWAHSQNRVPLEEAYVVILGGGRA
eukprot:364836-Chlamydomonas_euryale.AAC.16